MNHNNYNNDAQIEAPPNYSIPPDLFIVSDTTDKRIECDVVNPVLNNLFDQSKKAFIRFHVNKLVNNPMIYAEYEKYRQKLQKQNRNLQEVYGFIQLPNGDHGEEEELCAYGVRVGMNYRGELGDASKGVYLSKYPDTCTPCPFINDQRLRILICKVLLGKSRRLQPSETDANANSPPDPNYNSFIALTPELLKPETSTPQTRYINSLMYVYEIDGTTTNDRPSSIYPLSICEIQCNKPGPDFLNILVPHNNNSLVWSGTLKLQNYVIKHSVLHSHFSSSSKLRGLDNFLQFKVTVPYDTVCNCMPVMRLLQPDMTGILLRQPELALNDQQGCPLYVQYFILQCEHDESFDNLCTLMRKYELVGVSKLSSGTHIFLIPNGGLSMKLGLCLFNTATFHCISMSTRPSNQANTNWQSDPMITEQSKPPPRAVIDGSIIKKRWSEVSKMYQQKHTEDTRKHSTSSNEDQLEIVEDPLPIEKQHGQFRRTSNSSSSVDKQPEQLTNNHRRVSSFGNGEDIDFREPPLLNFNGHQVHRPLFPQIQRPSLQQRPLLPPPGLIKLPENLNSPNATGAVQNRTSRFGGPQILTIRSPALVSPRKVSPTVPPPLFPPKSNQADVTSTTGEQIVVIFDPDLIISPVLHVNQLRQIFQLAKTNNLRRDRPTIVFKWHMCINEELKNQLSDAPNNSFLANRATQIRDTLTDFVELVRSVDLHLCDRGQRNANKFLICALSIKRSSMESQTVFLSAAITSDSQQGKTFLSNDIELRSPDQLIQMIQQL